jgi:hypothetical protein
MHGDMDPTQWTLLDWIRFLLNLVVPTAIVVLYILFRMGLI